MTQESVEFHRFLLYFTDAESEDQYRDHILGKTLVYSRCAWGIVIFLVICFGFMDTYFFKETAGQVRLFRLAVVLFAAAAIWVSGQERFRRYMDWNGFAFVTLLSLFCNYLMRMDDTPGFSVYFAGMLLMFPGIFTVPGIGYRYAWVSMVSSPVLFMICQAGAGIPAQVYMAYLFFLVSSVIIYLYLGYLLERLFRQNYLGSADLKASLAQVRQLSGLLPMCAGCKKIRDDSGYWQQVETYLASRSEVQVSHGLCPDCLDKAYGKQDWYLQMKRKKAREAG